MKCVLVCEDENSIRDFVVINLKRSGYEVLEAASGEEAVALFNTHRSGVDIALLDVMLPGIDGFEVCNHIRKEDPATGIIMLTARTQDNEKVQGLMNGADDYVTKPFSPSELIARVDALYRRVQGLRAHQHEHAEELVSGEFVLSLRSRTLKKNGIPLDLTQMEFQIMEYFFANPGKAISRTSILNRVWGDEYFGDEKIVDVNIRRLRMKIEEDPSEPRNLVTVWGMGYRWVT